MTEESSTPKYNIIDLAELASPVEEIASNPIDSRRAIMEAKHLKDVVIGRFNQPERIIECRFDETNRAIYPAFKV